MNKRKRIRILSTVAIFMLALYFTACNNLPPSSSPQTSPSPAPTSSPLGDRSTLKEVSFFIDATESMAGFAAAANQSHHASLYQYLMSSLENSILALPSSKPQSFKYKFGRDIEALPDGTRLNDLALNEKFYLFNTVGQETQIQKIFSEKTPALKNKERLSVGKSLFVIITDLFQSKTDFGIVASSLEPYLSKGLAVGLLGVNSEFNGRIFDYTGNSSQSLDYQGLRPVYALVIGKTNDVIEYVERLSDEPKLKGNGKFTIFSNRLFDRNIDFFQKNISPFNVSSSLINQGFDGNNNYQFKFIGKSSELSEFTICADRPQPLSENLAGFQDFLQPDANSITVSVRDRESEMPDSNEIAAIYSSSDADMKKCKGKKGISENDPDPLVFRTRVYPEKLKSTERPHGNYIVDIAFKPNLKSYPKQWDDWNTDNVEKERSKTLNLTSFVKSIYSIAWKAYDSEIRLKFCVQV